MKTVVIAEYLRSPFTPSKNGELIKVRPDDLIAEVIKALVKKTGIKVGDIEDFPLGCAFPEGEQGLNLARLVVLLAGLPQSIAGVTINRFCGSSMQAIHQAAGAIMAGSGEVFLCGGVESMSRIPMGGFNFMPNPALYASCPGAYMSMGETAENLARKYNISRLSQEEFSFESQRRAAAAQKSGKFEDEIVPIVIKDHRVDKDSCIRPDTTLEGLASLKPAFDLKGTITAGTSSPLTDGAAAVLVCSEDYAKKSGLSILARIKSMAVVGCDPEIMGIGPVPASKKALERAGLTLKDMDIIEINEAFASQILVCIQELGIDRDKLNIDGGAIALGHPLGASGARITGKAASLLKREGKKYALVAMCIGGGQGIATVLEGLE